MDILAWLLIPAGLLPIVTAVVLRRYRHVPSAALRDRWHLSLVLALLGTVVAVLAANRIFEWGWSGVAVAGPLALVLLIVDVVSGKWLLDYWNGRFR